ncbi:MAG: TRAP transporter large permease [Pseudomonadales bacterium]|nr:TRAP transporter large permease [Pseudomonadales bacterium]NRA14567.1 TRAP transporter large permease [Oceanospirillaceae bacterium]
MGGDFEAILLIASMLGLVMLGLPIAYAVGLSTIITVYALGLPPEVVLLKLSDGVDNFSMLAIPFFVFAGAIMSEGGMAVRLVNFANIFVGFIRGGLAMVNILTSMFFGGISGSSVADTTSIGSIMIPMMKRQGYDDAFSVNVTISSSTQGVIIPPSHNAVIYAFAAGGTVSIAELFMAGIIPGIMIGVALMALAFVISLRRNYPKGEMVPLREAVKVSGQAFLGLITVLIIVGGVIGGVFTATESSAVAVVYAFIITFFVYRDYKFRDFPKLLHNVVKTVSIVMILIGFASTFGYLVALMQIPEKITELVLSISDNKYAILAMINVMLLVFGTVMDMAPLILICTPVLLPLVVEHAGMDPVHFGIMMMMNLSVGLITPPVGTTLFAGCAVGKVSIEKVTRTMWPFWLTLVFMLLLVTYIPQLTLWMPQLLGFR